MARDYKNPAWKTEWAQLVGDHPFLMIRNWDEYQVLTPNGYPAYYIKDYVNADFDAPLSIVVGGILNRLRRFRGRLGSNLPACMELLMSGMGVNGKDRHYVPGAVLELLRSGRLIPTNQADEVSKKRIEEKRKEKNTTKGSGDTPEPPSCGDMKFSIKEITEVEPL